MNTLKQSLCIFLVAATVWGCKKAEDPAPQPPAMELTASSTNAPAGQAITFTVKNPVDNIGSIQWDFGDNTPTVTGNSFSQTHSFTTGGTYTVTARVFKTSGATLPLTVTVTITGQVYLNGKLTYARIDSYNSNNNLWDYEYTGTDRLPDLYLRVRSRLGNDYQVLLAQSSVLQNFQVDGTPFSFSEVPFSIDGLDLLEVTLLNSNIGQGRPDNVITTFTLSKEGLSTMHGTAPVSYTWTGIDGTSSLYVTFTWN